MKAALVILGAAVALSTGCTRQAWPEAVHEGVPLTVGWGDGGGVSGKVLRVEPDWLTLEYHGGSILIPRERITSLRPVSP
jgi:hypothetical protein